MGSFPHPKEKAADRNPPPEKELRWYARQESNLGPKPQQKPQTPKQAAQNRAHVSDSIPSAVVLQGPAMPPDVADLARRLAALPEADRRALAKAIEGR